MKLTLGPVMIGTPVPFRGDEASAIFKRPAPGPVLLGPLGLAGDEVADKLHHGGIDMAVHHYPHDHYAYWQEWLGGHDLLEAPGAFGENISTSGLTEDTICIGDRLRMGSALVEVSQGRQPCWKIDHKFQRKGITAEVLRSGRSGWYYRVVEAGTLAEGDTLKLTERRHDDWTISRIFGLMFHKGAAKSELAELAQISALSVEWRKRAQARAEAAR